MNPRAVLLFSADELLQRAVINATLKSRRAMRIASTVPDTLNILRSELDDVDLILLDVDSDICGVFLLKALGYYCERMPVATITNFERDYTLPQELTKGLIARLGKPVTADDISTLIEEVCDATRSTSSQNPPVDGFLPDKCP